MVDRGVRAEMTWRPVLEHELEESLAISPCSLGDTLVTRRRAIAVWHQLLWSQAFHGLVIEAPPPVAGHRIVGFSASVFVTPAFADRETSTPEPGLNGRIISSIVQGESVVLSAGSLRRLNSGDGLSLVVMVSAWKPGLLTEEQASQVRVIQSKSFLELYAGYRLNRILAEPCNAVDIRATCGTAIGPFLW
jgi:hypothetical protein